jgi:K+ transporter
MAPREFRYPVVALATVATVIAAQGFISGSFSLASQEVALGLFPRLRIIHTHHGREGQIYVARSSPSAQITSELGPRAARGAASHARRQDE